MYCYFFAVLISMGSAQSLALLKPKKNKSPDMSTSLLTHDTKAQGSPTEPCMRAVIGRNYKNSRLLKK